MKERDSYGRFVKEHGLTGTRIYHIWRGMKDRCYDYNNKDYEKYGGRGIKICDEWLNDVKYFYNWAISHGYDDNLSIDRINVNGNYEPSNCRWATSIQQQNNTRINCNIIYNGEVKTASEWSRIYTDIGRSCISRRWHRGIRGDDLFKTAPKADKQTKHKHIRWDKNKHTWRVWFGKIPEIGDKSFHNLDGALTYRNKILKEHNMDIPD